MISIGVVAIGRNEGERLRACLESVRREGLRAVYVDSGSTDGSRELAMELGAEVVELDCSVAFNAARARNAGFERLMELLPGLGHVQYLDGDCVLAEGWVHKAIAVLDAHEELGAVCGRRRERFPEASLYNRLCDLEWNGPAGETEACGGDSIMRVAAFRNAGGFDPSVPAGEEPELCKRLRGKGWRIVRLDADMTWHDAAMTRFGQWWRRQVRTGHGGLDVTLRFGLPEFRRQVRSAWIWTVGWAVVAVLAAGLAAARPWIGGPALAGVLLAMPLQSARIAMRMRRSGEDLRTSVAYGLLTLLSKWAQVQGHVRYALNRVRGRMPGLIEYKASAVGAAHDGSNIPSRLV